MYEAFCKRMNVVQETSQPNIEGKIKLCRTRVLQINMYQCHSTISYLKWPQLIGETYNFYW